MLWMRTFVATLLSHWPSSCTTYNIYDLMLLTIPFGTTRSSLETFSTMVPLVSRIFLQIIRYNNAMIYMHEPQVHYSITFIIITFLSSLLSITVSTMSTVVLWPSSWQSPFYWWLNGEENQLFSWPMASTAQVKTCIKQTKNYKNHWTPLWKNVPHLLLLPAPGQVLISREALHCRESHTLD